MEIETNNSNIQTTEDDFDSVYQWSLQEEQKAMTRKNQGFGINTLYLIGISLLIFLIVFFVLYRANQNQKRNRNRKTAIDLMNDPNNVFDEFSQNFTENNENNDSKSLKDSQDFPVIDISEEITSPSKNSNLKPELDKIVQPTEKETNSNLNKDEKLEY
jgi:hypothetical protein